MDEKTNSVSKSEEMREKYMYMLFSLMKKREDIIISDKKTQFNSTEIRLLFEILSAKHEGKRLISTRLASLLGITRSAVSQIVNRLEENGVVKRVADDVDRKIAYIEITDEIMEIYHEDLEKCQDFIERVVRNFGEEKFQTMYTLLNDFIEVLEKEKKNCEN